MAGDQAACCEPHYQRKAHSEQRSVVLMTALTREEAPEFGVPQLLGGFGPAMVLQQGRRKVDGCKKDIRRAVVQHACAL